jgi:photosystem II stability/assembly factor-like uncharacterized protein/tRNA A-37 threonylcarbamoyl transferase component Bud32
MYLMSREGAVMPKRLTCLHGHQWESTTDLAPGETRVAEVCPVCGAISDPSVVGVGQPAPDTHDDLPPAPVSTLQSLPGSAATPASVAALPSFSEPPPRLGGYEIVGELGRGGMGVVYKAYQTKLKRHVALKMLMAGRVAGQEELARFRTEAEAVARLQHPNIVHIYNIGRQGGRSYLVLEYVGGGSLAHKLRGKPQPPREAAALAETLARAVASAHKHGIIHRDLKPANVLLMPDGLPKITDFGLAKRLDVESGQTQSGAIMGTPSYMAPEQAAGKVHHIGPHTDVWALGAILYELLTGRPPFRGETTLETLHHVVFEELEPPSRVQADVPPELEAICLKCLQKDRAARYATAEALADDLRRYLERPAPAAPPPPAPTVEQRAVPTVEERAVPRRSRVPWLAVILFGTVGLTALALYLLVGRGGRPSWEALQVGTGTEQFDRLAFPTRTTGYAASRQGLFKTQDGARTWRPVLKEELGRVHLLSFTDERTGYLGTDRLRQTEDGGETWTAVDLPGQVGMLAVTGVVRDPGGWTLAAGTTQAGELAVFRRRAGAAGWEKLDPAATGCWGGQGEPYRRWFPGALAHLGPEQAVLALYKGYEDGGALLRTTDGGNTWATLFQAEQDLYAVHFTDERHGWLAGFHGALWRTDDGGTTWASEPNPGGVTVGCLAFSEHGAPLGVAPLWNGKVLLSVAGQGWQVVDVPLGYSIPSAAVVDPACAYVLGADGRIARYTDPRVYSPR